MQANFEIMRRYICSGRKTYFCDPAISKRWFITRTSVEIHSDFLQRCLLPRRSPLTHRFESKVYAWSNFIYPYRYSQHSRNLSIFTIYAFYLSVSQLERPCNARPFYSLSQQLPTHAHHMHVRTTSKPFDAPYHSSLISQRLVPQHFILQTAYPGCIGVRSEPNF